MPVEQRRKTEAYSRLSSAARELNAALLSAQTLGFLGYVELEWVLRDDDLVQEVVTYLTPEGEPEDTPDANQT